MNYISSRGHFLGHVAYNTVSLTSKALWNVTVGTAVKLWEVGPFRSAYKVYSLQGFEKLTKALIANIQLLSRLSAIGDTFKKAQKSIEDQRATVFATLVLESVDGFLFEDANTHRISLGWPARDAGIKLLYAAGAFCELGKYLYKNEVFKFEKCLEWSNKFASFEVYGYKPSKWPVCESLTHTPKSFFIFAAATWEVKSWLVPALYTLVGRIYDPVVTPSLRAQRDKLVSTESMLKLTGSVGKMVLTSCGTFYGSQLWFAIVNDITQNASLFSFFIKKVELR